jgi:hypothetical protein
MTCLEKLARANRWRLRAGDPHLSKQAQGGFSRASFASTELDGWNGLFLVPMNGQIWEVMLSDGWGWRHLSVTNAQKRQLPPWEIMTRMKETFFADDAWVVMFVPPKEVYINDHPYCHHLWEPLNEPLPMPHFVMV